MLTVISVPYHLGIRGQAVGAGPEEVLRTGILSELGAAAELVDVGDSAPWRAVNTELTSAVASAIRAGTLPLVLAGNCNSCLGTLNGIREFKPGIVWFDAHGDFHTPQTSLSGSVEGMSLAMATLEFVAEDTVVLAGARDLEPGEAERVRERLTYIPTADLSSSQLPAIRNVYIHIDVDVLDPSVSPGVNFQGTGGISVKQLSESLAFAMRRFAVAAIAITNYNPSKDDGRTSAIICRLIRQISNLRRTAGSR